MHRRRAPSESLDRIVRLRRLLTGEHRLVAPLLLLLLVSVPPGPAHAGAPPSPDSLIPRAPFVTRLPWLIQRGSYELVAEGSVARKEPPPFHEGIRADPDRSRGEVVLDLSGGLGDRVEAAARIGIQNVQSDTDSEGAVPTDLEIAFAYAFAPRRKGGTALAGRFTAKVPTAPDSGTAGTDEADLGLALSIGRRGRRTGLFGAVGLELLGNPLGNGSQDDVATYGAGLWWSPQPRARLIAEAEGKAFSRFGNSPATARIGGSWLLFPAPSARALSAYAVLFRGLNRDAARWGFSIGFSVLKF
jgi:hypothetical protein